MPCSSRSSKPARRCKTAASPLPSSDNAIDRLSSNARDQLVEAGNLIGQTLRESFALPVAFALDGIVDEKGEVSWLEMNSNPILPPEGYERMFAELFA